MSGAFRDAVMDLKNPSKQEAEMKEKLNTMNTEKEQLVQELEANKAEMADVVAKLSEKEEALAEAEAEITEMQKELASLQAVKEQMEADKAQAKMDARKSVLSEVVAEDKLDTTFEAMKEMSDEHFTAVLSVMQAQYQAEQETEMFQEAGVSDEGSEMSAEDYLTQHLMKTYQSK